MHPPDYLMTPTFLDSLMCLVSKNQMFTREKMSHGVHMAAILDFGRRVFLILANIIFGHNFSHKCHIKTNKPTFLYNLGTRKRMLPLVFM